MDIGANVGALTLLMAKLADQGRVIAVEPGPSTVERLRQNLALNPELKQRVTVLPVGLAEQTGTLCWQEDANVPGNAGLLGTTGDRVTVETLDHLVQQLQLPRLDFIKIDVEGMEWEVIQGGLMTITQYRPILYYETLESFRTIRGFDLYGKIHALLTGLGYQHFCVQSQGTLQAIEDLAVLRSPNTLAVPQEKLNAVRQG
jgi:FkbM family methyltransferase